MDQLKEIIDKYENLNKDELLELLSVANHKFYKKGAYFLNEGDVCNRSGFIEAGILRHFMIDKNGKQKILQFSVPNEFVSDCESFMLQRPALYSIQAIEDTSIVEFNNIRLKKLSKRFPVFERINTKIIQEILSIYKEHIMIIMNSSPHERYQYLLTKKPEFILRISVTHLSQFLGVSRETVSRIRAKNKQVY